MFSWLPLKGHYKYDAVLLMMEKNICRYMAGDVYRLIGYSILNLGTIETKQGFGI